MAKLVVGKNPILSNLPKGNKSISATLFESVMINGTRMCAWCVDVPAVENKKFCSTECRDSCYIHCAPQTNTGIAHILERDGSFSCPHCPTNWHGDIEKAKKIVIEKADKAIEWFKKIDRLPAETVEESISVWEKHKEIILGGGITHHVVEELKKIVDPQFAPQIDHVIPESSGGETFGFENLQVICKYCYAEKSKKDQSF